ncbi:hypothetical protein Ccr10_gp347 [Caulobacter phage Ccr10]|nr:hypothetical protein Ccr10_gp347 [Caulobacter phage Ccr10]
MAVALTVVSVETESTIQGVDPDAAHGRLIEVLHTAAEAGLGEMTLEVKAEIAALLQQASVELSHCRPV